jgi:hypothetical protein
MLAEIVIGVVVIGWILSKSEAPPPSRLNLDSRDLVASLREEETRYESSRSAVPTLPELEAEVKDPPTPPPTWTPRQGTAVDPTIWGGFILKDPAWADLPEYVASLPFESSWRLDRAIRLDDPHGLAGVWSLDLHELDVKAASIALRAFIEDARAQGLHECRLITGRGNHSRGGGKLRDVAEEALNWLEFDRQIQSYFDGRGHFDVTFRRSQIPAD